MSALDELILDDLLVIESETHDDYPGLVHRAAKELEDLRKEIVSLHHVLSECEDNLKSMVEQYCRGHNFNQNDSSKYEYAHEFMSAGECTFEYLVARGLAEYLENGVDIRLKPLEEK